MIFILLSSVKAELQLWFLLHTYIGPAWHYCLTLSIIIKIKKKVLNRLLGAIRGCKGEFIKVKYDITLINKGLWTIKVDGKVNPKEDPCST